MIPNAIKLIAVWALSTLTISLRPLKRPARAARPVVARIFVGFGHMMSDPNAQGDFKLPRELRRPFFLAAYLATLAVAAYYGFHWVENIAEPQKSAFTIPTAGAKMAPGLVALVLLAGMLFSLPVYAITWGVGMLGEFLRRSDQSDIIANRDKTIEELRAQLEEAQAKSEQDKEILRNQIRRSGQEPEA